MKFLHQNFRILIPIAVLIVSSAVLFLISPISDKSTSAATYDIALPNLCNGPRIPGSLGCMAVPRVGTVIGGGWTVTGPVGASSWSFTTTLGGVVYDCTAACQNHSIMLFPPTGTVVRISGESTLEGVSSGHPGQPIRITCRPRGFQPIATSVMQAPTSFNLASKPASVKDKITSGVSPGPWMAGTSGSFRLELHGPYPTRISSGSPGPIVATAVTPIFYNAPESHDVDIPVSSITKGGYYYAMISLNNPWAGSGNILNTGWRSAAFIQTELMWATFQPFVKSNVGSAKGTYQTGNETYVTADSGDNITNTITSFAATNLANADLGVSGDYWPAGMKLRVCVDLYGPYQSPQPQSPTVPAGAPLVETKCNGDGKPGSPTSYFENINESKQFVFSAPTKPGYYYFTERVPRVNQPVADTTQLVVSNWTSKFNPSDQNEKFVVRFQPVAESRMVGNRENVNSTDKGAVFDCNESKQNVYFGNGNPIMDITKNPPTPISLANLPPTKVTCENITDKIYIGATDRRDLLNASNVIDGNVRKQHVDEKSWLKDSAGYVPISFRVKLYGPFATPEKRLQPDNEVGKTVQVVPYFGTGTPPSVFVDQTTQPVAATPLITTNNGPKWNFNSNDYYEAVFRQDKDGGVNLMMIDSTDPEQSTTSLKLAPGFYVSVVEIHRNDNGPLSTPTTPTSNSGNLFISDNFYSAWGDPFESTSITIPVYAWSERYNDKNSDFLNYKVGDIVNDNIWINGFDPAWHRKLLPTDVNLTRIPIKDSLGRDMVTHSILDWNGAGDNFYGYAPNSSIPGIGARFLDGYFARDTLKNVVVTLYGPYESKPLDNTRETHCQVYDPNDNDDKIAKLVAKRWTLPSMDFRTGTNLNPGYKIPEGGEGWYVFFIEYAGSDRVYPFSSDCADINEIFSVDGITVKNPSLKTIIKPVSGKAPTVIHDDVSITGEADSVKANSTVILTLYRRTGDAYNIGEDEKLCSVKFNVSATGQFSTKSYLNTDGTVKPTNSPAGAPNPNRCYAKTGGTYYWIEEFRKPGSPGEPYQPIPETPNPGESTEINEDKPKEPKITTKAQTNVEIGEPFGDTAIVSGIPTGNTKKYKIVLYAYGPQKADGSKPVCEEPIFNWEKIITKDGSYKSDKIKVVKVPGKTVAEDTYWLVTGSKRIQIDEGSGNIWWIEHLYIEDEQTEGGWKLVDSGKCGQPHETTRVKPDKPPPPDSGVFERNVPLAIGLGIAVAATIWLLTMKMPVLRRK